MDWWNSLRGTCWPLASVAAQGAWRMRSSFQDSRKLMEAKQLGSRQHLEKHREGMDPRQLLAQLPAGLS